MTKTLATRSLYIDDTIFDDLTSIGMQGEVLLQLSNKYPIVQQAIKLLNIIGMKNKMFPEIPFYALSFCDLEDVSGIIVGGMPIKTNLMNWTGSAYSYENKSKITTAFHKMVAKEAATEWMVNSMKSDNSLIQSKGILMMHDALSTTMEDMRVCSSLWEPIIWLILNTISIYNNKIPILFTTNLATTKFKSAVLSSTNVMSIHLDELAKTTNNNRVVEAFQGMANNIIQNANNGNNSRNILVRFYIDMK